MLRVLRRGASGGLLAFPRPPLPAFTSPPSWALWARLLASSGLGPGLQTRPGLSGRGELDISVPGVQTGPGLSGRGACPSPPAPRLAAPALSRFYARERRPSRHFGPEKLKEAASSADPAHSEARRTAERKGASPLSSGDDGDADAGPSFSGRSGAVSSGPRLGGGGGFGGGGSGDGGIGGWGGPEPPPGFAELLAPLLARPALFVSRDIEWATLLVGWEQANRYGIMDEHGAVVGFIAEESPSCV